MGKDSPAAAPPRDLAKEIQQILSQGPALYGSQALLSPQNVGLDLSNLKLALEGAPAGQRTTTITNPVQGWRNASTGEFSTTDPRGDIGPLGFKVVNGKIQKATDWQPWTQNETTTSTSDQPAVTGLYDILGGATDRLGEITNRANTASRTATLADLRNLNPGQASIMDSLTKDAQAGLAAGDRLTPDQTYNIVNPVRADWASRGLGDSAPAQLDESLQLYAGGNALGQQRRTNAASTADLSSKLYTLPALSLSGSPTAAAQGFLGVGSSYGQQPNIMQQLGGYGSDLFNTNFNATTANNINSANANNANTQAAVGTAIALASLFCWAAREVYGAENPDWLRFRSWLLEDAPEKLRNWYKAHGPEWAVRLSRNPLAKQVVRRWMDRRLKGKV